MNLNAESSHAERPWLLVMLLTLLSSSVHRGQVEFRAIGGPGIDRGEVVLPYADGAYLLGTTQPQSADVLSPTSSTTTTT